MKLKLIIFSILLSAFLACNNKKETTSEEEQYDSDTVVNNLNPRDKDTVTVLLDTVQADTTIPNAGKK